MRIAYFDAFSGLSGDMIVGALLDCGADFDAMCAALASLGLGGYRVGRGIRTLSGIAAVKFEVEVTERQPERHFGEIRTMIENAAELSATVKTSATAIFQALADAEAKVHHTTPDEVHFHEVGAVDSIIDVVGAAWCLESLAVGEIVVSLLPGGAGFARSQHGPIPVPAPATAELLAGFPIRIGDGAAEMVTPTGAAVLRALARPAALPLAFEIERIGYGAGTRTFDDRPNVLRVMLGSRRAAFETDEMIEIAANIDDLNPQIYEHLTGRLLASGARDVTVTPTMMKKGRPGVILTVIAEAASRQKLAEIIFAETTTIGLRSHPVARLKLPREIREVETRYGKIRVKISAADDGRAAGFATISPEYEDCRRAAAENRVALRVVMEAARDAARRQLS